MKRFREGAKMWSPNSHIWRTYLKLLDAIKTSRWVSLCCQPSMVMRFHEPESNIQTTPITTSVGKRYTHAYSSTDQFVAIFFLQ
jgi:hypothetical protein